MQPSKSDCPHGGLMFEGGDPETCERCRAWRAEANYEAVVEKFDACRAALARRYKSDTGREPNPPEGDKRPWHEWLIEQSDAKGSSQ